MLLPKLLIANRGEIACRIMRTCKRLGVKTVAVFSDADRNAMHVALADEAVHLGGPMASESYLNADKLVQAALQTRAAAVHPGYGFLSENAGFAQQVVQAGLVFVGPPASAIASMGSKSGSKRIMTAAGVACTPGYHGEDQSLERLRHEAARVGFPLMLKADAGGGGKGMRVVESMAELDENVAACRREALSSFKDDKILMERFVRQARHVEFQVFADTQGNAVHLFERDCSVQRRHQKVLEESPAPLLDPALRAEMGRAAVQAAKAVGYVGAGTVEFMLDAADPLRSFYFMEMNTRLQVEHPVSEMVTGLDLVEWQLRVASGQPLPLHRQEDVRIAGHALEARVYAENPAQNFLPGSGPLRYLREPAAGPCVRVETGVRQGDVVSIYYDPMIAKLVVHAPSRAEALALMLAKLNEYRVAGLATNLDFIRACVAHPAFAAGGVATSFIAENAHALLPGQPDELEAEHAFGALGFGTDSRLVALVVAAHDALVRPRQAAAAEELAPFFRVGPVASKRLLDLAAGPGKRRVRVEVSCTPPDAAGWTAVSLAEKGAKGPAGGIVQGQARVATGGPEDAVLDVMLDGRLVAGLCVVRLPQAKHAAVSVFSAGKLARLSYHVDLLPADFQPPASAASSSGRAATGVATLHAPLTGKVTRVLVKPGDAVEPNQALVVLEAMKMEHSVRAPRKGVVKQVMVHAGQLVSDGADVCSVEG
jgi:3-methylcrotonyl-CoA carboxylase alpha subunit